MPLSTNLRSAIFMVVSMAGFTSNDALTKSVTESMNMGQVMLVRGFFATILIGALAWHFGALRVSRNVLHPMIGLRVVGELGATVCFLSALSHMPLANITAVLQALPLAVTMGAALFLGEPVGWRRWCAIGAGFLGVMVIVRPGFEGFNNYSLFALGSVLFCTIRDLATRSVPAEIPTLFLSTMTTVAITACGAVLIMPLGGWSPVSTGDMTMLFAAAVLLLFGYQFIIMAMRQGDISFIAPFRYTALLWAILLGFLVFGDVPDAAIVVGAAIIVLSGIYSLYREQIVGRKTPIIESTSPAMAPDGT